MYPTHHTAKTLYVTDPADPATTYAYRYLGPPATASTPPPLLCLTHFRATMDLWDPLLLNTLAAQAPHGRPILLLDLPGVGQSTGTIAPTIRRMSTQVLTFLSLLQLSRLSILGFSMGGLTAQLVALDGPSFPTHPVTIHKLILAGTSPSHGPGVQPNSPERSAAVVQLATGADVSFDSFRGLFFLDTPSSTAAGRAWFARMQERNEATSGEQRSLPVSAGHADGGAGMMTQAGAMAAFGSDKEEDRRDGSFDRLGDLSGVEVLVAQGKDDFMIPSVNSFVLQQQLPRAWLKVFPDSGHGFLYQFAEEFAGDVGRFLDA